MEYLGYFGALCIGLILGLTGAGGSILTVPILVYLMGINPVVATGYSLFVVGATSAFGALQNIRQGLVDVKTAFLFAIPSFIAVFLTRKFIVPALPEYIGNQNIAVPKESFLMLMFALVMLAVAVSMLRKKKAAVIEEQQTNLVVAMSRMFVVGILIGMVGAGGGFLFIPVLLFIAKLPMRKAVGTSLLIIALNSLIGFTGDIGNHTIDWQFLIGFTSLSVIGILIGTHFSRQVNEQQLRKGFAWFVIAMAIFILCRELVRL
ncbi:MAG: sulfite exporter TauE/SafE family protein [Flavobacterium sp.]